MNKPTYGRRGGLKDFDRGTRNVSHAFGKTAVLTHSLKVGGGVALESEGERLVAHMLNLDPDVAAYTAQPFALELTTGSIALNDEDKAALRARAIRHGGKAVFYTPDFGVVWASGVRGVIEAKLDRFPGDAEYQRKLSLAKRILFGLGYEFLKLVTPSDWRHPLRSNMPLLHQAHLRRDMWPAPAVADHILQLQQAGATTMGDYLRGLSLDARMSPLLLVSGHLEANVIDHALCFATPAGPAHGALDHLQFIRRLAQ